MAERKKVYLVGTISTKIALAHLPPDLVLNSVDKK